MTSEPGYDFQLQVIPKGDTAYGLALYQKRPGKYGAANAEPTKVRCTPLKNMANS